MATIEETKKKLHFVAFVPSKGKLVVASDAPKLSISGSNEQLSFSNSALKELGLEGKFIKLFYSSEQKVIGWQVRDRLEQPELKNGWKLVTADKNNHTWKVSVGKILATFNGHKKGTGYKNLVVKKYRDASTSVGGNGEAVYYYIEVKPETTIEVVNEAYGRAPSPPRVG
jgi:hypothetical protein